MTTIFITTLFIGFIYFFRRVQQHFELKKIRKQQAIDKIEWDAKIERWKREGILDDNGNFTEKGKPMFKKFASDITKIFS